MLSRGPECTIIHPVPLHIARECREFSPLPRSNPFPRSNRMSRRDDLVSQEHSRRVPWHGVALFRIYHQPSCPSSYRSGVSGVFSTPAVKSSVKTRRPSTERTLSSTALACCRAVLNAPSSIPSLFVSLGSVRSFLHSRGRIECRDETACY